MLDTAMAENKKKQKYLTKTVKFGEKQFTLFSLDGVTWSSRKDELHMILERQELERKSFNQIIGEQPAEKAAEDGASKEEKDVDDDVADLIVPEDDEILPITTEPARKPIKPRISAALKTKSHADLAIKMKISKRNTKEESAPVSKSPAKKPARADATPQNVMASPKSRATSKPAKKASKVKAKKRA